MTIHRVTKVLKVRFILTIIERSGKFMDEMAKKINRKKTVPK